MPFRPYADAYSPEVLKAMTEAYTKALEAWPHIDRSVLAERILQAASKGVTDVRALTRVALQTQH
jgi:hypothetical protein